MVKQIPSWHYSYISSHSKMLYWHIVTSITPHWIFYLPICVYIRTFKWFIRKSLSDSFVSGHRSLFLVNYNCTLFDDKPLYLVAHLPKRIGVAVVSMHSDQKPLLDYALNCLKSIVPKLTIYIIIKQKYLLYFKLDKHIHFEFFSLLNNHQW